MSENSILTKPNNNRYGNDNKFKKNNLNFCKNFRRKTKMSSQKSPSSSSSCSSLSPHPSHCLTNLSKPVFTSKNSFKSLSKSFVSSILILSLVFQFSGICFADVTPSLFDPSQGKPFQHFLSPSPPPPLSFSHFIVSFL